MSKEAPFIGLALQVDDLLERQQRLQEENRVLRQKVAKLAHAYAHVHEKNKAAGDRIRRIIQPLKEQPV